MLAKQHARSTEVYTQTQIVCRATRREAEDFYYYFAEEQADKEALEYFRRQKLLSTEKLSKEAEHYQRQHINRFTEATGKKYSGLFPGMHAVVGSPDDVVWPAPGFTDTELGVLMEPEVCHGATEVYAGVQA